MGFFDFLKRRDLAKESMGDNAIGLHNTGVLYMDQGLYAEAEICFARSLEILEKHLDLNSPAGTKCLDKLAKANELQGKVERAVNYYSRSLAIKERGLGKDHPSVTQARLEIAHLLKTITDNKDGIKDKPVVETGQLKPKAEVYQYLILKFDGLLHPIVMHSAVAGINTDVRERLVEQAKKIGGILYSAPSESLSLPVYQVGSRYPLDPEFTPEIME